MDVVMSRFGSWLDSVKADGRKENENSAATTVSHSLQAESLNTIPTNTDTGRGRSRGIRERVRRVVGVWSWRLGVSVARRHHRSLRLSSDGVTAAGIVSVGSSTWLTFGERALVESVGDPATVERSSSLCGLSRGLERSERDVASASSFRRASSSFSNLRSHCQNQCIHNGISDTHLRPKTSM